MNLRKLAILTLALSVLATSAPVHADGGRRGDVPEILKLVLRNINKRKYSATRVVEFRKNSERVRHTEFIVKDGARSRVWFPAESSFAGQVIVEDGGRRLHFFPGKNEIHVLPPRREEAFSRLAEMAKRDDDFKFKTSKGEGIAGRATTRLDVFDKKGNILQKLWIDSSTGLILKRELYDHAGTLVGSFEFTRVDYNPKILESDFRIERQGARVVTPTELAKRLAEQYDMLPVFLPDSQGYRLEGSRVFRMRGKAVMHQTYRKRGSELSLFQVNGELDLSDWVRRGQSDRDFNAYAWVSRNRTFALVGDVDESDLKRLAKTVGDTGNAPY